MHTDKASLTNELHGSLELHGWITPLDAFVVGIPLYWNPNAPRAYLLFRIYRHLV